MPEGPEVECTKLSLQPIIGKFIKKIQFTSLSQKYPKYQNKQVDFDFFSGKRLERIERKGKFLIWVFNFGKIILNHLGMSGKWLFVEEKQELPSHIKIIIHFEDFEKLAVFDDVRNFGQFRIFESYDQVLQYNPIKKIGVDGLALPFPMEDFLINLNKSNYKNREIGDILLDQNLVAGLGNIYRSESLFRAGIKPTRLVKSLNIKTKRNLGYAISETLQQALECQGSTFNIQPFETPLGLGSAQNWHKVYDKENQLCQICEAEIRAIKRNGRRIFFCPNCQK
ncbi:MAG: Fpg/Nei family DNA glycosylase [Asgard group archaeon]|nr:Fpg/Nei family DNA glycosylase [Asgard group archaeon]